MTWTVVVVAVHEKALRDFSGAQSPMALVSIQLLLLTGVILTVASVLTYRWLAVKANGGMTYDEWAATNPREARRQRKVRRS